MPKSLFVIPCGTSVTIASGSLEATVTCAAIRFDKITYELTYFYQGDYKTAWCHESEFHTVNVKKDRIGFKKNHG